MAMESCDRSRVVFRYTSRCWGLEFWQTLMHLQKVAAGVSMVVGGGVAGGHTNLRRHDDPTQQKAVAGCQCRS